MLKEYIKEENRKKETIQNALSNLSLLLQDIIIEIDVINGCLYEESEEDYEMVD